MLLILILLIVRGTRCCSILLQLLPPVRCYYRCTCMQCLRSIRSNRAPGRFNCCCCSACICSSRMASKRCATSNNSNNSINSKECSSNEAIDLLTDSLPSMLGFERAVEFTTKGDDYITAMVTLHALHDFTYSSPSHKSQGKGSFVRHRCEVILPLLSDTAVVQS